MAISKLMGFSISGTVTNGEEPLLLSVRLYDRMENFPQNPLQTKTTNENGEYDFAIDEPGHYFVVATPNQPELPLVFYENKLYPYLADFIHVNSY